MAEGDCGAAWSALTADTVVVRGQVRVLCWSGGLAGFDECDPNPFVAVAGASVAVFAGGLLVSGAGVRPRREVREVGKRDMSAPISARIACAVRIDNGCVWPTRTIALPP